MRKVYDIETLSNCFIYCDVDLDTGEETTFIISSMIDDLERLVEHLSQKDLLLIGYNNLAFDSQVLEYIMSNYNIWIGYGKRYDDLAEIIYRESQRVIASSNSGRFPNISEYKLRIKNHDLFKMWHFDNPARATRLKDLQVAMDWENVLDMPISHRDKITNLDQLYTVVRYCKNDIRSTAEFYKRSRQQIELREQLGKTFGISLINASDAKLGQELFAKVMSDRTGKSMYEIKKGRTHRESIDLGSLLLDSISFYHHELKSLLNTVRKTVVKETKGAFKQSVTINNITFDMGLGGIHACVRPGVYEAVSGRSILDIDVKSFYPWLAIANKWFPEHLGEMFYILCKEFFDERDKIPKADPVNYAYKIMLNAVYGKSNDEDSFFYDPKYTMQITVNGQLLILMLAESLIGIKSCNVLQANTDGITIMIDNDLLETAMESCRKWEKKTGLTLEYKKYSKMIIRDVNNYMAIDEKGEVKYKGAFELFSSNDPSFKDWHKDPSFRIVAKAVSEYFIGGIDVETTVRSETDIFQFCGRAKFKSDSTGVIRYIDNKGSLCEEKQQKTTRYYVSKNGHKFIKVFDDGRESIICKGGKIGIYNKHIPNNEISEFAIDHSFYIKEAKKIIETIEGPKNQLSLWG